MLGVVVISSEYSTGAIRASLLAVPKRLPMLAAKAAVFTAIDLVISAIIVFAVFFISTAILRSHVSITLGQPGVTRACIGGVLYLTVLGLFALAIGGLVRHMIGAIATVIALVLVVPPLISLIPGTIANHIHASTGPCKEPDSLDGSVNSVTPLFGSPTNWPSAERIPDSHGGKRYGLPDSTPSTFRWGGEMSSAMVIAVVGVCGTLASAIITQLFARRSRHQELEDAERHRLAEQETAVKQRKTDQLRSCYVRLNANDRSSSIPMMWRLCVGRLPCRARIAAAQAHAHLGWVAGEVLADYVQAERPQDRGGRLVFEKELERGPDQYFGGYLTAS